MDNILNMKNIFKPHSNIFESSAAVVDDALILTLPDARNPIVWRMELGNVKASALEVRPSENDAFHLVLKNPKGDVHDVAAFDTKENAIHALMQVSNALKNAPAKKMMLPNIEHPEIKAKKPSNLFQKPDRESVKWLIAFGGVLLVIFLYAHIVKTSPNLNIGGIQTQEAATSIDGTPSQESGVPQSADDMLRGF